MFERFTTDARQVVVGAQGEARALNHAWIGTEHLLLAVLADGDGAADAAALGDLGIDLDDVRRRVEASFGPGALDGPAVLRRRRWLRRRRVESGSQGTAVTTRREVTCASRSEPSCHSRSPCGSR